MDQKTLFETAKNIIYGIVPDDITYQAIANIPEHDVFIFFPGADMIRNHYFGKKIHLCMICNGKSGKCTQDCTFCSQSMFSKTDVPVFPLLEKEKLQQGFMHTSETLVNRYSIVTSGKRLSKSEVRAVAEAIGELELNRINSCVSLGILEQDDFEILKKAGVSRYHHNLETAQSFFAQVCTTHTYQERIDTIKEAKKSGFSICAGGVFGIGETDDQVLELALTLKRLNVDAVPINFLVPIKKTPLENSCELTPLRCLKIISLFRYVLPDKDIIICGGREENLKELHSLIFYAGASGIMTGDYLTTTGRTLSKDLELLEQLNLAVKEK
mmetsp:Transcript_9782/g.5104  ORF Transcript_9782/g.5104 Transcript_9782/m.5104 type:complete len:327 (-) Transcript_9782:1238-2218(-)